jgi:hypothetical protein
MRKLLAILAIATFAVGFAIPAAADPVTFMLYNPNGASEITSLHASRLADLHGKTICEIANAQWQYDRTFPLIRELLQKQFPTAKIIPYTEVAWTRAQNEDLEYIARMVKKKGCQAVIVGNAG